MTSETHTQALARKEQGDKQTLVEQSVKLPELAPHQALMNVLFAAQNPTDVQSLDSNAFGDGVVLGCDFSGSVEAVDSDVKHLKKGDVVAGLIWGVKDNVVSETKGLGAYSKYTYVDDRISFKIPQGLGQDEAATVPLAACTAWLALFSKDCLSIPRKNSSTSVLIWGGSSSVGSYAIQLATLYGFNVITTCSPRNFESVKRLGAAHVFDYRDDSVIDKIKDVAPDLAYVFDTIGAGDSSKTASNAVKSDGGTVCTVRPGKANTEGVAARVKITDVLVWTAFLKDHNYGSFSWPASIDDHELAAELFTKLPDLLTSGKLKPNTVKLLEGLGSVEEGFEMHRQGEISSFKVVYRV